MYGLLTLNPPQQWGKRTQENDEPVVADESEDIPDEQVYIYIYNCSPTRLD